jgi:anaphase-promoting complex subunit 5
LQGESIATAFENIAKAAHLNVTKATTNVTGPILIMKAAVFGRVGLARLAWSSGETFLECHADEAPTDDLLKCRCRMASLLVQKGHYNEATELMEGVPRHVMRVLKYEQYWTFFAGMLRLRRHLHRSDFDAASYILERLRGQGAPDVETGLALSLLEVDLLMRRGVYSEALDLIESLAKETHPESTDVYAQVKLLMIKARGLALCKRPLKGFSIAVRAANMANRARILPALWESAGILANILINLHEFAAAVKVLEAIVPQVLECEDCDLAARTYALLVDGYMGLGGEEEPKSVKREERINKAMENIDAAFAQFKYVEDLCGQCDMLAKKATILNLRGDLVLANDFASQYLGLKKEYEAARL